jgi:hypothetical protein
LERAEERVCWDVWMEEEEDVGRGAGASSGAVGGCGSEYVRGRGRGCG